MLARVEADQRLFAKHLHWFNSTCYGTYMTQRRGPQEAHSQIPHKAAGRREVPVLTHTREGDVSVRDLLTAGGLRGFTAKELLA